MKTEETKARDRERTLRNRRKREAMLAAPGSLVSDLARVRELLVKAEEEFSSGLRRRAYGTLGEADVILQGVRSTIRALNGKRTGDI